MKLRRLKGQNVSKKKKYKEKSLKDAAMCERGRQKENNEKQRKNSLSSVITDKKSEVR